MNLRAPFCLLCVTAICFLLAACKATSADKPELVAQSGPSSVQAPQAVLSEIRIAYPANGAVIPASSSYIAGACPPGKHLKCNGADVKVNAQGYFAHVVTLEPGANKFTLVEAGEPQKTLELTVTREVQPPPIAADTFRLAINTAQPHDDLGVAAGDKIDLSVHATPSSQVKVQLGKHVVELRPASAIKAAIKASRRHKRKKGSALPPNVNLGLDAAYGKVFQRWPSSAPDVYLGFYRVAPEDHWQNITPKFTLNHSGRSTSAAAECRISTIAQPLLAQTRRDDTIVRTGPGLSRATPLPEGVRLWVDGWQGEQVRCLYSTTQHFWIAKDDLAFESDNGESGPAPQSIVRTINILSDDYGADIVVPLNQRLPYQIEQHLKPERLIMRIYGATADTDWVTPLVPSDSERELVDRVAWKQLADGVYEVTVLLKQARQWGFKSDYQGTNLHLHIKRAPRLVHKGNGNANGNGNGNGSAKGNGNGSGNGSARRLEGLVICLDPGHGGKETGAIGCGGMREAEINLGIALKLRDLLQEEGARVIMTRTTDVDVSLNQRVKIANESNVDILLSVHNNALPDGRDPWAEHGTSSYWYHPQSIALAHALKLGVQQDLGFADLATRWQNLALTRPSAMLAVLDEVGFVINPDEYAVLEQPTGQLKAAEGLLKGLVDYLNPP